MTWAREVSSQGTRKRQPDPERETAGGRVVEGVYTGQDVMGDPPREKETSLGKQAQGHQDTSVPGRRQMDSKGSL